MCNDLESLFWDRHYIVNDPNWIIDMIESVYYPELELKSKEIELQIEETDGNGFDIHGECIIFEDEIDNND